jgi:hypothetical protein
MVETPATWATSSSVALPVPRALTMLLLLIVFLFTEPTLIAP